MTLNGPAAAALLAALLSFVGPVAASAQDSAQASAQAAACANPAGVLTSFYDANDAGHLNAAASSLSPDVVFDTWATGVNGYIMAKRHLEGLKALRGYLGQARGVRWHLPEMPPDGPVFQQTKLSVEGSTVRFMLVPDRKRANGRSYNPYRVEAVLDGCRIRSLQVVELVTWL
jgi:hypothetical protein